MDKLKANMAAAEMLYGEGNFYPASVGNKSDAYVIKKRDRSGGELLKGAFNLFTNDSDLVAVVKCLGEKHGIAIMPTGSPSFPWCASNDGRLTVDGNDYRLFEEAVAAACIATQEGV